jgi:hypothetical protein
MKILLLTLWLCAAAVPVFAQNSQGQNNNNQGHGLTPVSWRDESLGSGSLALRHVVLRFRGIL